MAAQTNNVAKRGATKQEKKKESKFHNACDNLVQPSLFLQSAVILRGREKGGRRGCLHHVEIQPLPKHPFKSEVCKRQGDTSQSVMKDFWRWRGDCVGVWVAAGLIAWAIEKVEGVFFLGGEAGKWMGVEGGGVGWGGWGRCQEIMWQSLLVWAAVVQRVNHEGQIRPGRYHGVSRLHHLKAHVVERLDDGHWGGNKKRSVQWLYWDYINNKASMIHAW